MQSLDVNKKNIYYVILVGRNWFYNGCINEEWMNESMNDETNLKSRHNILEKRNTTEIEMCRDHHLTTYAAIP